MSADPMDVKIRKGEHAFQNGRPYEALRIFDSILNKDPDNVLALSNRGVVLNRLGRHQEAEKSFCMALDLEDGNKNAIFNLISNYIETNNWTKAQEALNCHGHNLTEEDLELIRQKVESRLISRDSTGLIDEHSVKPPATFFHTQQLINETFNKNLFFIVGCPKSGTTWFQNIINGHPEILCAGESNINMIRRFLSQACDLYNADVSKINSAYIGQDEPYAVLEESDLNYLFISAIGLLFTYLAKTEPVNCIGMKNPDHLINMHTTAKFIPHMKYIHIIRDGRDVAVSGWFHNLRTERQSLEQQYATFKAYVENIARAWNLDVRKARSFGQKHPDRYFELRYEDLHHRADEVIGDILGFLGVDASQHMIDLCKQAGSFEKLSNGRHPGQEDRTSQ
ncbi:MAG: sulfotransferase [Deltaproteobacteria bacterium]|nr:sulfotransferase [Deltaproteobacteria bacterium]